MSSPAKDLPFDLAVSKSTVTQSRLPAIGVEAAVDSPSVPRANQAVSRENPRGSVGYMEKHSNYTVLQQHILFWDRDNDGKITPLDTYIGFRELGFNILFSLLAVIIINVNLSYPTRLACSWIPDPMFRIYVPSIHKAKHGSDSATIDNEGRFVPQAFENIFAKYDTKGDGSLSLGDLFRMMRGQRAAIDPFGWAAAVFEWLTTWLLVQKGGRVHKEDLRQVLDGSIFWRIREQRQRPAGWNQGFGMGGDGFIGSSKIFGDTH